MLEALHKLLEIIKFPARYIFALLAADTLFLFSPDRYLNILGLLQYRPRARFYLGLLFFVLIALLIVRLFDYAHARYASHYFKKWGLKRLLSATAEEKLILARYFHYRTTTQLLPIQSGVVQGLVNDKVLYRASSVSQPDLQNPMSFGICFAYNLNAWAWECINDHPEIFSDLENSLRR